MKFLGLMGMLLWLGTLFGMADGAEQMRLDAALLEKDKVGIDAPVLWSATKCDADKKQLADKFPALGAEITAGTEPCFRWLIGRVAMPAFCAASALGEVWHLGQGPPQVS